MRRHALWLSLAVVAAPLLVHLGLQYRSLAQLQKTLPYYRKAYTRQYLTGVARQISKLYEEKAEEVLNLPASAFLYRYPPVVRMQDMKWQARRERRKLFDYEAISAHFSRHQFKGARLLFVGIVAGPVDPIFADVEYFNPVTCSFGRFAAGQENGAAHAAAANWTAMTMTKTAPQTLQLTVDERDPNNRIIVKPIADEKSRVVGVAGMILDEAYFKNELAAAFDSSLPANFPAEYRDVLVTALTADDKLVYANQPADEGKAFDVYLKLPFVFADWYLGLRMKQMSEEEWSRQYFQSNLAISLLTALVLLAGIALTLRTAARAMRLSQMKADFVSNVSHELRTPLASIRVFGEFLKLGRVRAPEKMREYGGYIETESRRLTQLINNILDFSRIESGQKSYHFEPTGLESVVAETLKTFGVRLEQSGFAIGLETPPQSLPLLELDADAIAQAFINLLDNAVKYSGEARAIDVRLAEQDGYVALAVSDHGIGIAREECAKVFEKFYRVSTGLVHDVKGSGLGLSIVKHIVEAHQGKVAVESEPGRGSTFTILLPVAAQPRATTQTKTGPLLSAPAEI
jgi:signal transduction histidine kinase